MAESLIYFAIMCLTAFIMTGIGISQLKSRKPVGFYTGVKPPEEKQLRDVKAWNRKHGIMWIVYGGVIAGSGLVTVVIEASGLADAGVSEYTEVLLMIAQIAVIIGGVFVMACYHIRLEKLYRL